MWLYKNKKVKCHGDLLPGCTDFVYMIHYTNGQKYVGKKTVMSLRKRPPLKGYKRNRRVMIKHPFAKYEGSHDNAAGLKIAEKEILYQCSSRKSATYLEVALLFHHDAVFDPLFLNANIGGLYFDNDLNGLLED